MEEKYIPLLITIIIVVVIFIFVILEDTIKYYKELTEYKNGIIEKNLQTIHQLVLERDTYRAALMQPPKPVLIPQQPSLRNTIIEYLRKNPNTTTSGVLRGISNDYTNITQKELTRILYSLQHKHVLVAKGGSGGVYWSVIKPE